MIENNQGNNLGKVLRQRRVSLSLTLRGLSTMSGISSSHLGRIEKGDRFPSASVLKKIARPLGYDEGELFSLAGYFSTQSSMAKGDIITYGKGNLDSYVSTVLSQEPIEIQRVTLGILNILKSIAKIRE